MTGRFTAYPLYSSSVTCVNLSLRKAGKTTILRPLIRVITEEKLWKSQPSDCAWYQYNSRKIWPYYRQYINREKPRMGHAKLVKTGKPPAGVRWIGLWLARPDCSSESMRLPYSIWALCTECPSRSRIGYRMMVSKCCFFHFVVVGGSAIDKASRSV